MCSLVLEVGLGTGAVFLHGHHAPMTFMTAHVFTFARKAFLDVDLRPVRTISDLANLYKHAQPLPRLSCV
jgi:hypothetical protein